MQMFSKKLIPWVTVVGVLAAAPLALAQQSGARAAEKKQAKVGEKAPDFKLEDCAGEKHALSDYADKVVVLEWINKECPWSDKARGYVARLIEAHDGGDVIWLGIDSTHWRKPADNVKYAKDKKIEFPILLDKDGKVGRMYGARTTPHMFVINKGTLLYDGALHNDQYGREDEADVRHYVDEALAAVLKGKDVPVSETKPWGCSVKYKGAKQPQKR